MRKKSKASLIKYCLCFVYVFALLFVIASGNKITKTVTSNNNNVKSLQSSRIINEHDVIETLKTVKSVTDIKNYGKQYKINFTGTLTGYGPDCEGCSGVVACSPYSNVKNNIYYTDKKYGKIRILAADPSVPCGSIVRISNYKFNDNQDFYGVVLDRGSAIKGLTMDLLYSSEKETELIGRNYNIKFTIERWGWNENN